ncbi:MAG: helix-turn-helix domain protein [Haloquadratum walsbyi J07HQW2]|uniref:Helix-turn-helix domain protein n=1 Tax=Haloquadratum walsbyi J07HQW2 TaxID=1238425 RepID=U1MZN2_9EURY|nr:MAG: helix-turn-helix domain protein [Haloquadratum walsbyi J07HQW2]
MHYAYRYRLHPTDSHREKLDSGINTCRQLHNHALNELEQIPDQLPGLKDWYGELSDLYSTVSQAVVMHIENIIKALSESKGTATTSEVSTGKHPPNSGASRTFSLASSSIIKTVRPSSHSQFRNSQTVQSQFTAKFPKVSLSKGMCQERADW